MDITNKTGKPLRVPLPGGKMLYLGPGKTGQVTNKALKHPQLVKLLEAGEIESADGAPKRKKAGGGNIGGLPTSSRHGGSGAMRQSGDR